MGDFTLLSYNINCIVFQQNEKKIKKITIMKVAKSNIKFIFSLFFPFRTLPVKIFVHKHSKVKSFLFFKLKNMKVSRVF